MSGEGPAGAARGEGEGAGGGASADAPRWAVDLHLHTSASHDCLCPPAAVVRRARRAGLDRIAVTDHDRIEGALEARDLDPELVIVAEEVRTAEGIDLIGLFLSRHVAPGAPLEEVAEAIRSQGGIVYLPHPFDRFRGVDPEALERLAAVVDAVEGFNARVHTRSRNERARRWAAERDLPLGAGSDAHTLAEIGRGRVRLPPFGDGPGLLASLRRGRIEGRASGPWVHLASTWAKLRKRLPL